MAVLPVVFVTLVLQALWGSAFSSQLGLRNLAAASDADNDATEVSSYKYCRSCVIIDNVCYNHTYLFDLNAPFGLKPVIKKMGIMKSTNVLYYTFEPIFNDPEYSKAAYVSLLSPQYSGVITGRQTFNFGTFDINQEQKQVYLGGSDGIWVTNYFTSNPTLFNERGNFITNIVSQYYVYFTKRGTSGIIKNVNGHYEYILKNTMIKNFVLDKVLGYNVVYLTNSGLFIMFNSNWPTSPVKLHNSPYIRGLTVDNTGTVYAWHVDGIYKVVLGRVLSQSKLTHISGISPDAMTFDKDNNIIYSIRKSLYKLTKVGHWYCSSG